MSKFTKLKTDNSKTGAAPDSIFYRPQSIITDQYKNERIAQQQKQQQLLSNVNRPKTNGTNGSNTNNANRGRGRRSLLKPVSRIAIGGNRQNKLKTNKPTTKQPSSQLLRNYKKQYSRSQFDGFKKEELPPGTIKCSLQRHNIGCHRAFVGHFAGTKGPKFKKARISSIREDDLQTQLERIQYDNTLNAKKREEIIAKLKFGLDDDEESRKRYTKARDFWFKFEAAPEPKSNDKNHNHNHNTKEEDDSRRLWLGKPKQEDKNYTYVLLQWEMDSRNARVYPASFIEFGLSTQLVADGQASAESAEKRHRQQLEKWRKQQAEKSIMEKLGNLFGHDANGNKKAKKKKLTADELTDEVKEELYGQYMDKIDLTKEDWKMLEDMLGDEKFNKFKEEYEIHTKDKMNDAARFGILTTGDDQTRSLIEDKVLSKRLKSNKTRGQLDELNDYDEFMSDDEDENNLNNYDRIDDHEEDVLTDDDGNESEQDELFKKLEKNIDEDITNKEYDLPEKDAKKKEFEEDSDDDEEDEGAVWSISDDDSDEEQDDDLDGGVTIKRKGNKKGKEDQEENNNQNKNSRKRKHPDGDDKSGKGKKGKSNNKKRKLNPEEEKKLKAEVSEVLIRLLKKNPDGLEMTQLWSKINIALSVDNQTFKSILPIVFKKYVETKKVGGKTKFVLKKQYR